MRFISLLGPAILAIASLATECVGVGATSATQTIHCDAQVLNFAPYVWKPSGKCESARAEAALPGAYLRAIVTNTTRLCLMIDGTVNAGCPPTSMPTIEYSIDRGEFQIVPLTRNDAIYALPLAEGLDPKKPHRVEVVFRASDLTADRWKSRKTHLAIAGLRGDAGMQIDACPRRPHLAIGFGDSITEGVGVDGLFTSWQKLEVNNARATWLPMVAAALDCEYGQLGSGGHGIARTIEMPPLTETWDHYNAKDSRLTDGRLAPEPDYIFCAMGTNDFDLNITAQYLKWLTEIRAACPHSRIFCIVPPLGVHRDEVAAAVAARNQAGDGFVYLIETEPLRESFASGRPTHLAYDGVHPTIYGQAMLATLIVSEVQRILGQE